MKWQDYEEILITPKPGGKLTNASAELKMNYGLAKSSWKIENGTFKLSVTIPANTTAMLVLPNGATVAETEQGVDIVKSKNDYVFNERR